MTSIDVETVVSNEAGQTHSPHGLSYPEAQALGLQFDAETPEDVGEPKGTEDAGSVESLDFITAYKAGEIPPGDVPEINQVDPGFEASAEEAPEGGNAPAEENSEVAAEDDAA